jgi:hypothetical protein
VFSTGVASQNLTEGMKLYYASMSPGACLEKVVKLVEYIPAADRPDAAKRLTSLCEATALVEKRFGSMTEAYISPDFLGLWTRSTMPTLQGSLRKLLWKSAPMGLAVAVHDPRTVGSLRL